MRNTMAHRLINTTYSIQSIIKDKGLFKKLLIKREIRSLYKNLIQETKKTDYAAVDIVRFSLLVDTAINLGLCSKNVQIGNFSIEIDCIKGARKASYPTIGRIKMEPTNISDSDPDGYNTSTIYRAHMDSEVDQTGTINMSWIVVGKADYSDFISHSKKYDTNLETLSEVSKPKEEITDIERLISMSYNLIPYIFIIYIELICDALKERYLKK